MNMAEFEKLHIHILEDNNVTNPSCCQKTLKQMISANVPSVEFHRPKCMNESKHVTIKETRDNSVLSLKP